MSILSIANLSAGYGSREIIHEISAAAKAGEFIALIGPNGSGKSTLLKSIVGIVKPASGRLSFDGQDILSLPPKRRAKSIAYLAQSREAAPAMTVGDIARLGRAPFRGSLGKISPEGQAAISMALSRTDAAQFEDRRFDTLSGGEQARVLLAREPIAALDPYYQITMMDILKSETQAGHTVIAALHDLALATQFADRIWVMHQGRIIADNTPKKALSESVLKTVFGIKAPHGGFKVVSLTG